MKILDNAGKTSILNRLRLHEHHSTVPTVGFAVETIVADRVQFTVWDVGGQVIRIEKFNYFARILIC